MHIMEVYNLTSLGQNGKYYYFPSRKHTYIMLTPFNSAFI